MKKKKSLCKLRYLPVLFAVILAVPGAVCFMIRTAGLRESAEERVTGHVSVELPRPEFDLTGLHSYSGIVLRERDGEIMTGFHEDDRIYPASLTKIMTCIVAIEQLDDMEEKVKLDEEIFGSLYQQGASMAGFLPGEEVRAADLLYGMILPSGGECSVGMAVHIAGSQEKFVELMNEKAEELRMENTRFVNVTGLHHEDHYSTVRDIGVLLRYSLQNRTFREIFCSESYNVPPTNLHPDGLVLKSSMFRLSGDWSVEGGSVKGGKTGYTDEAGLCLATAAFIDNEWYIAVTAGAKGDHGTAAYHVRDAFSLYGQIS